MTVLGWAACWGHEAVVAQLLNAGADIFLTDNEGYFVLAIAESYGHDRVADLIKFSSGDIRRSTA